MRTKEKKTWIIGIGNSDSDGVVFRKFVGTEAGVKTKLMVLIREDRNADRESWDYGTECKSEIATDPDGTMNGYNCFTTYHIDYTAKPFEAIKEVA